ncbi:Rossmann-fold NAD(P)-binding domain-containing protein [Nonomuraea jabiensis]|uniref:hypothetical protein n=1 Tax=Nonomuraea jabiensis TaxID=882448 RepID=UPI0036A41F9C
MDADLAARGATVLCTAATTGAATTRWNGHELRFAVNYLAGYLLTRLLLPVLRESAPSRIVNVSSLGQAPIDFGDVSGRFFDGLRPSQALEQAYDAGARARLRELSENLSKARPPAD